MSNYICHFCGKDIQPDQVLFVDSTYTNAYFTDEQRYQFLLKCSSDYPFESGNSFRGSYFTCTEPNIVSRWDENGFPRELQARSCDGLTPRELMQMPANENERKSISTDTEIVALRVRACPRCHCRLPAEFGLIPTFSVCLFGGRAAGKTAYLISLFQQLSTQLEASNLGTAVLLEESRRYIEPQMELFAKTGATTPTPVGARLFPLVLRYMNLNFNPPKHCFIAMYDIAGEGISDEDYLAAHEGLKRADTIMLMLDPNMLCQGAYFHTVSSNTREDYNRFAAPFEEAEAESHDFFSGSMTRFLSDAYIVAKDLHLKHIIAVVTKMDQPLSVDAQLFASPNCILKLNNITTVHHNAVDTSVLLEVSNQLVRFLDHKLEASAADKNVLQQIVRAFDNQVKTPLMLGVSTHTVTANKDGCAQFEYKFSSDGAKHRILEPFLAILYVNGMVAHKETGTSIRPATAGNTKTRRGGIFGRRRRLKR